MSESQLKLGWVTPFSAASDVSAFSRNLLTHVARPDVDVTLFVNENGARYGTTLRTVPLSEKGEFAELMTGLDAVIYNIGNNSESHGRIFELMRRHAGVAILHDYTYQHLFAWRIFERNCGRQSYARLLRDLYGSRGFNAAISSGISSRERAFYGPWDTDYVTEFPLLEPICNLASAVVVHSEFLEGLVQSFFDGPILRLFLPWDQKPSLSASQIAAWKSRTASQTGCTFVIFGHISRAKCIETVVEAMFSSKILRESARLVVAGATSGHEYIDQLKLMVDAAGLHNNISFELNVSDTRLLAIKEAADAFVNLRWPNTEGASGSLVEQLNAGKPVICYKGGCYGEVPEGAVRHVDRKDGIGAVRTALEQILEDRGYRINVGEAGLKWVRTRGSDEYANRLISFLLQHREELAARAAYLDPLRATLLGNMPLSLERAQWRTNLRKSRRIIKNLDLDPYVFSPEPFLEWSDADLIEYVVRVLIPFDLRASSKPEIARTLASMGRLHLHRVVSQLRFFSQADPVAVGTRVSRINDVRFWELLTYCDVYTQAAALYGAVLGRICSLEEREAVVNALGSDHERPSLALHFIEFATSFEYIMNFGADPLMDGIRDWAERQILFSKSRLVELEIDSTVQFQISNPILNSVLEGGGWHPVEENGVWSRSRNAAVMFRAAWDNKISVDLEVSLAIADKSSQTVSIFDDETCIATAILAPGSHTLKAPLRSRECTEIRIGFRLARGYNPQLQSGSDDGRWLGVYLKEIAIRAQRAEEDTADPISGADDVDQITIVPAKPVSMVATQRTATAAADEASVG